MPSYEGLGWLRLLMKLRFKETTSHKFY